MNLTTLSQSQQLKSWGAPQNTDKFWYQVPGGANLVDSGHMGLPNPPDWYAAYDLESLIGWLGEAFCELVRLDGGSYKATTKFGYRYSQQGYGNTPLEAVFALCEAVKGGK